jgi:tight adherence protein B
MSVIGFAFFVVIAGATLCLLQARAQWWTERRVASIGSRIRGASGGGRGAIVDWFRALAAPPRTSRQRTGRRWVTAALGAALGARVAGLPGAVLGSGVALGAVHAVHRSHANRRAQSLERQLAEVVDACALAVRGGASVAQAIGVGAQEVDEPMKSLVARVVSDQRLGASFEDAISELAATIGTEDARLFALVMAIHHRSGGNVASPLKEVATTIRHRIAVRRELRALTAQARISGVVLGTLPIAFFLVLAATSHRELAPVYRSPAGAAMIVGGLILEALAFLWIRHLIRVEA